MEMEVKYLVLNSLEQVEEKILELYPKIEYVEELRLPADYFDTEDLKFEQAKMALRIRKEKGKWIGCYKGTTAQEHIFVEEEIELSDVERGQDDWFTRLDNYAVIQDIVGTGEIKCRVRIDTRRKVFKLKRNGIEIEVVLDWVDYMDGVAHEERVELELKDGTFVDFIEFVQEFGDKIPGLQETKSSKYQTGVKLVRLGK